MEKLVQGVHYFQNIGFREREQLFAKLKHGQHPQACFITCADSRIVPNLITNTEPGDLFIIRNVGNIIPCYGTSNNGELAAIEYAAVALEITDFIICGHSGCGAMKALVTTPPGAETPVPTVMQWLRHAEATRVIIREHYSHLKGDALVKAAAEENVLVQLEHIRTLPVIAARVSTGKVRLHGWMYKIETGEIFCYDSQIGQFVKFGDDRIPPATGGQRGNGVERSTLPQEKRGTSRRAKAAR